MAIETISYTSQDGMPSGVIVECEVFRWPNFVMPCCGHTEEVAIHVPLSNGDEEERAQFAAEALGLAALDPNRFAPEHPCTKFDGLVANQANTG